MTIRPSKRRGRRKKNNNDDDDALTYDIGSQSCPCNPPHERPFSWWRGGGSIIMTRMMMP